MRGNNDFIENFLAYFCNEYNASVERKNQVEKYLSNYSISDLAGLEDQITQGLIAKKISLYTEKLKSYF